MANACFSLNSYSWNNYSIPKAAGAKGIIATNRAGAVEKPGSSVTQKIVICQCDAGMSCPTLGGELDALLPLPAAVLVGLPIGDLGAGPLGLIPPRASHFNGFGVLAVE